MNALLALLSGAVAAALVIAFIVVAPKAYWRLAAATRATDPTAGTAPVGVGDQDGSAAPAADAPDLVDLVLSGYDART